MKLKLDAEGHAVLQDGKPVYVHDDGKEVAHDAAATVATINRLYGEAKGYREAKEAAEKSLKAFEGLDDPAAAKKALETLANLDAKKLVDAGEIDKVKAEISKAYQAQLDEATKKATEFESQLYNEKIGGSFARSKVRQDKLVEAYDAATTQAVFGQNFKVEDGKITAYDQHGGKIFSRSRPGEMADFDEALEILVENHPNKLNIMKHTGGSGGGAPGNTGNPAPGGSKTMTRAQFDNQSPAAKQAFMREGGKLTD